MPLSAAPPDAPVTREEFSRLHTLVQNLEFSFKHVVDSNERLDCIVNHRFQAIERDVADQKSHSRRQSRDIQELGKQVGQGYDYKQPSQGYGGYDAPHGTDENSAPTGDKAFYTQGRKSHDLRSGGGGKPRGGFRNNYDSRNGYGRGQYHG